MPFCSRSVERSAIVKSCRVRGRRCDLPAWSAEGALPRGNSPQPSGLPGDERSRSASSGSRHPTHSRAAVPTRGEVERSCRRPSPDGPPARRARAFRARRGSSCARTPPTVIVCRMRRPLAIAGQGAALCSGVARPSRMLDRPPSAAARSCATRRAAEPSALAPSTRPGRVATDLLGDRGPGSRAGIAPLRRSERRRRLGAPVLRTLPRPTRHVPRLRPELLVAGVFSRQRAN